MSERHMRASSSSEEQLLVVNADLVLRYRLAADALDLSTSESNLTDQTDRQAEFIDMLVSNYNPDYTIKVMDAEKIRTELNEAISHFRSEMVEAGRTPFVISLDPVFFSHNLADYVYQESRASLVSEERLIDLEHNPRGYVNRFAQKNDSATNGAGKSSKGQVEEIVALLDECQAPVALAFVEDYVKTGKSLLGRFKILMDRPGIQTTVFSGLMNNDAKRFLHGVADTVAMVEVTEGQHMRHMDTSDLLPTLGGRMLGGWTSDSNEIALQVAVTEYGLQIPLAVDATYGRYPWQVDIYKSETSPRFLRALGKFCLDTSRQYWRALEGSANKELRWEDLQVLTGTLKTCYPVQDLTSIREMTPIPPTPHRTVQSIEEYETYAR